MTYKFTAKIWQYQGQGAWHFITISLENAEEIKAITSDMHRGFGSVRVFVRIGSSKWTTSIFPDTKRKSYLLPIKHEIRKVNNLHAGEEVKVNLTLIDV